MFDKIRKYINLSSLPHEHRENFLHLFFDIAWYGLLSGSAISFVTLYMVRIGSSAFEVGLMGAIPGIVTIIAAIPSGNWLRKNRIDTSVFWSSVLFRFFYLLWIPIPMMFEPRFQIRLFIGITLLMNIPGTILNVGFNALFAETVPVDWRGFVAGTRNALLAVTFSITSIVCGLVLETVYFPLNYQLVFLFGFIGAVMSSYHLYRIKIPGIISSSVGIKSKIGDFANPGRLRALGDVLKPGVGLRVLARVNKIKILNSDILKGHFGLVLFVLFSFHFTQYLAIPLFPVYWVETLHLSDQVLSYANGLFYVFVFLGSTQLAGYTRKYGNHKMLVAGAILMAFYPGLTAIAWDEKLILAASVIGGFAWSLAGGVLANYLLEQIPENDRPVYLTWYTFTLNVAILLGSLLGPLISEFVGVTFALGIFTFGRILSGLLISRLGFEKQA